MKKIRKQLLAVSMTAALTVSFIWQAHGEAVYAEPAAGENMEQLEAEQQEAKALRDVEIASQMVNNYHDIDEEAPASVSEYLDTVSQDGSSLFGERAGLDAKYDPRESAAASSVPQIRNQGALGSCWAHSAMAMVEMNLWKQGKISGQYLDNMSEFQTVYFMNHDWTDPLGLCTNDNFRTVDSSGSTDLSATWYENGGNTAYTQFMLMDWVGAVSESQYTDTAYENLVQQTANASLSDDYAIQKDIAHVKDICVINTEDRDVIKQMVMGRGAVGVSYYHEGQTTSTDGQVTNYFNSDTNAYYYNVGGTTNHAVAIVGWDDNFSKGNFSQSCQPDADGAWLIRNSWGANWGDHGYFWLSYEDKSIANVAYALEAAVKEDAGYYDHNYQYDGGIGNTSMSYSSTGSNYGGIQEANVFTAKGNETLEAVAIYTDANYDYQVEIYKNLRDNTDPASGDLVTAKSGSQMYKGYHIIELEQEVDLTADEIFSVVVTLKDRGNISDTQISIDCNISASWICSEVQAEAGESFMRAAVTSGTEQNWSEIQGKDGLYNARIKAYTNDIPTKTATVANKEDSDAYALSYTYGDTIPVPSEQNFTTTNDDTNRVWKFVWYSGDQTGADIDLGQVQPLDVTVPSEAGTYTLAVSVSSRNYQTAETRLKITVDPKQAAALDQTMKAAKNYAHTYTFDASAMLQDEIGGEVAYSIAAVKDDNHIFSSTPSLEGSILSVPVAETDVDASADVEIAFANPNYTFTNATLHVELIDKTPVKLTGITFPESGTYSGTEFAYSGTPTWQTEDGQTVDVSGTDVLYEGTGAAEYSSAQAPINAGEYRITITVNDTDQQYIGAASAAFSIAKKSITVTAKDKNISAGEQIPSLENSMEGTDYVIEGILSADTLDGQACMAYTDQDGVQTTPDNRKAGIYKISISGFESSNYDIQYVAGTLTITGAGNTPGTSGSSGGSGSSGSSGWSGPSNIGGSNTPGAQPVNPQPADPQPDPVPDDPAPADPFKTETIHNDNGTTSEITTGTITNEDDNTVDITEIVNKDANGKVTGSSKRSVITVSQNGVSQIEVNVEKDASGNVTNALGVIRATESAVIRETVIRGDMVRQAVQAAEMDSLKVKLRVENEDGSFAYSVTVNTADLKTGSSMYIVIRKANNERVLVNAKTYMVLENGDVSGSIKGKQSYELLSASSMEKLSSEILKTIQVKKSSRTIKKSRTTKMELKNILNMENVKSITYSVSEKSVAAVTKKGAVKGKKAGSAIVKAKVTLKNGKTKTVRMKIKVK